jgi:osmotically-inducible protein OsmY
MSNAEFAQAASNEQAAYPQGEATHIAIAADDEIARRAANILRWHALIPAEKITIRVTDGHVTLSGDVDSPFERIAAEQSISRLRHLKGISNQIAAIAVKGVVEGDDE